MNTGPTGVVTPLRLAAFVAVTLAAVGAVVWGRVRTVDVPQVAVWADVPAVCAGPGVPLAALDTALEWWAERGHHATRSCDAWTVSIDVDPTIDQRASVEDVTLTHGLTVLHAEGGVAVAAEIRVLPHASALVLAHELGHALGYQHPPAAPTGHLMHALRPGWDGRGLQRGAP